MIYDSKYRVWIGIEQRLDGLTGRYGAGAYITLTLDPGPGEANVEVNLSVDMAKAIARGLSKTAKRAVA